MPLADLNPLLAGLLYPIIKEEYPIVSKRENLGYQVKSLSDARQRDIISESLTVFKNEENNRFVQISESLFAINSTIEGDWDNFGDIVADLLVKINDVLQDERLIRHIHIRRIYNAVVDDLKEIQGQNINFVQPSFLGTNKLLSFSVNSEYQVNFESIFGINSLSVFPNDPNKEQVLLDFSVLNNVPESVKMSNIKEWFAYSKGLIDLAKKEIVKT